MVGFLLTFKYKIDAVEKRKYLIFKCLKYTTV